MKTIVKTVLILMFPFVLYADEVDCAFLDELGLNPSEYERYCEKIKRSREEAREAAKREAVLTHGVALLGRTGMSCQELLNPPFTGMQLHNLVPEAVPEDTRVLFRPLRTLENRPNRLTLFATEDGEITGWTCG